MSDQHEQQGGEFDVAIIGMACRFPGADDVEEFWSLLREGREAITHFSEDELRAAGVPDEVLRTPGYVRSIGRLRDVTGFDAGFFGYAPREAEVLEPAHRIFLECAWEALETAGHDPARVPGRIGVYAGAGNASYTENNVEPNAEVMASVGALQSGLAGGKDFLATRAAYKLGLRGPALSVQTACSTSLVAVHLAVQGLLTGETDMALAGGANVIVPQETGYLHAPGSIVSPDGHCRSFDTRSGGTLSASGVGVVVLKRLSDALRDGDPVRAVIRGSAVNNDGAARVAFTAPGVDGQAAVIGEALAAADVDPSTIGYVEAHGSGTDLGDTIEIAALTRAYRKHTDRAGFCTVGAVKSNIGHPDTAAGIAGLIKTVLAMEHGEIPPTVHFTAPNPRLEIDGSPFVVSGSLRRWETEGPRRAGVSSFGIGGTNAHVILEEAPARPPSGPSRPWQVLTVSARSPRALDAATDRLAAHLESRPGLPLADVAFTLQEGRRAFPYRRALAVREGEDAAALLRARTPERTSAGTVEAASRSVAFLFPGLGDHYPNMARGLYEAEPAFRAEVDRCAEILLPILGEDVRAVLFPGDAPSDQAQAGGIDLRGMMQRAKETDPAAERLNRTELAQPAVFVIDYALAKLWMSWGIVPDAVIGHSLGEYAAACIAGILSLEDALALVADRARLIQPLPGGAMLSVSMDEDAVRPFLSADVAVATVNAPGLTVVAGPEDAVAAVEAKVAEAGHVARRLPTTHAFHSPMMAPAADRLAARVAAASLRPPRIPMVGNVTGTWITDAEATDPAYWTRHLLGTVRFAEGVAELLREPGRVLLEVGPGQTLSTFVRQRPEAEGEHAPAAVVPSLRYAYDRKPDAQFLAEAVGRLWIAGVEPDWSAYRRGEQRHRLVLPTYPWERQRYWIDAPKGGAAAPVAVDDTRKRPDAADWTWVPTWTRTPAPAGQRKDVVLVGEHGPLADRIETALERAGHHVFFLRAGDGFSAGRRLYTVRPGVREDYRTLAASFRDQEIEPDVVIHADAVRDPHAAFPELLLLADALGATCRTEMVIVTARAQEVTGGEEVDPAAAALLGAARVIPQEAPAVRCRVVDVADDGIETAVRVAAEATSGADDDVVAYRGRHRWVRGFRAARPFVAAARVREGGAYLLAGAMDARAAATAAALARAGGVRIALVGDAPEALVRGVREAGAEVRIASAGSPDAAALAAAMSEATEGWGAPDGVFLFPPLDALGDFGAIGTAEPAWGGQVRAMEQRLDAAAEALDALAASAGGKRPGFVVVESTLAGVLGSVARARLAAASALTDAYAGTRGWTSAAWDHWNTEDGGAGGIDPSEVPAALDAVLALAGEPAVLVTSVDLHARIRQATAPVASDEPAAATMYERPELDVEYHAPTNEVEETLAKLWSDLLGIGRIGIHDDFFGLGGHSLLATQIVARVRDLFQLELPLQAIFEAPTIARFAQLVEDAIIAELESLSEDEAAALMG